MATIIVSADGGAFDNLVASSGTLSISSGGARSILCSSPTSDLEYTVKLTGEASTDGATMVLQSATYTRASYNIEIVYSSSTPTVDLDFSKASLATVWGEILGQDDLIVLGGGDDNVAAGAGDDIVSTNGGNDRITGEQGNDAINGGDGIDVAVYRGMRDDYTFKWEDTSSTLTDRSSDRDGTDTLIGIERLQFSDKKIALDLAPTGHAGLALEFIGALAPSLIGNPGVVGLILGNFDQGTSMHDLCQVAVDIGLVSQLAGSDSNVDLARLVYRNLLGSEADATTANSLAGYLQGSGGSMSKADFLATIAGLELNQTHIDLVGLQQTGIEYT